tara:strand:- start:548 stop:1042 length:495 start_codon:yes stop_codon:yes gene_type:complete
MSKVKKLYRDFFGLKEAINVKKDDLQDPEIQKLVNDPNAIVNVTTEELIDEAQLVNNLKDYNGHVIYQLRDSQEALPVAKEIQQWTTKKGFTIIAHKKSKTGRTGYFYFRIGEDPGTESQKIQGYFSQLPELTKFAFKKPGQQQPTPDMQMQTRTAPRRTIRKI